MKIKTALLLSLFTISFFKSQTDSSLLYSSPKYHAGNKAFFGYVRKYIIYPKHERDYGIEGGVSALIYISKEGKVKFVNTLGDNLNFRNEIKRLMTLMSDWVPGTLNGCEIDTFIVQRFVFSQNVPKFSKDTSIYELNSYSVLANEADLKDYERREAAYEAGRFNWKPLHNKALKEFMRENYLGAIDLFKESIQKGNNTSSVYYDLSVAYYNAGDNQNSCFYLREAALRGNERAFKEFVQTCK